MKKVILACIVIILLGDGIYLYIEKSNNNTSGPISTIPLDTPVTATDTQGFETALREQFAKNWPEGKYIDGCGAESLVGVRNITRTTTGFTMDMDYNCGFIIRGAPPSTTNVTVLYSGKVIGVPKP